MAMTSGAEQSFLFLTGHDYASPKRSKTHFVIDALAKRGETRVFSSGFSLLTRLKGDGVVQTDGPPENKVSTINGVSSYVWKTPLHPFNPRRRLLEPFSKFAFDVYRTAAPRKLREWVETSRVILVESGISVLFLRQLREWNKDAAIIYIASDDLATIGCDPYLIRNLSEQAPAISWACLSSRHLAALLPAGVSKYFTPQGVDKTIVDRADPSPYESGRNAVSIGSMLFDPWFFEIAVKAFPDVAFHVIGSKASKDALPEGVRWYPELPFERLPAFMKHADFGIAPYRDAPNVEYLCDTSLKLIQYGLFGLPAACPDFAAGDHPLRFGYKPGDADSVIGAVRAAMSCEDRTSAHIYDWGEVTERILAPPADALIE